MGEGGDVCGLAASDEIGVGDDLAVDPVCAGVGQIGVEGGPGGHGVAFDDSRFDEGLWAVADGRDRLAAFGKLANEGDCGLVHAKIVGIHYATGQDEGVVIARSGIVDEAVDLDGSSPVGLIPPLDLALVDGEDLAFGSGVLEVLPWFGEFGLLEAVGCEDGDLSPFQFGILGIHVLLLFYPGCDACWRPAMSGSGQYPVRDAKWG